LNAVVVDAMITDPDGDLAKASIQVIDNESLDVLWSEQRLIEGKMSNLTFSWPFEIFQITNSSITMEPIIAFNIVGEPPERETYMAYLVPCTIKLAPESSNIDAVAYFGEDGEFHALIGVDGFTHYMSKELLEIVQPQKSYGDYVMNNITLEEGLSALSFFNLNIEKGMEAYPMLLLARSPLHHYKLRLDRIAVSPAEYIVELNAEDIGGNKRKVSERISV
jgi:hypothetical protein